MKNMFLSLLLVASQFQAFSQATDTEGCKDHPLFNRMPHTTISECTHNFDQVEIPVAPGQNDSKEGTKTFIAYVYDYESGAPAPSFYQIVKNYENAITGKGGKRIFYHAETGVATFNLKSAGKEVWVVLNDHGGIGEGQFAITILEMEAMVQDIQANEMLDALNKDGYIALYINFETGKAAIQPGSQKIVDEIATLLRNNPTLKISVEGHTDNTGTAAGNKTLSESRARSVMDALIAKGIDKTRLSSKGWGQEKSIADNRTEEGKAKNRRVEIVKM